MNEDFEALENELRGLRPRAPSAFLEARVESAVEPRRRICSAVLRGLASAGFAAGIAWLATLTPGASDFRGTALRPVDAQQTLQSARTEGWVTLDDGTQAQRLRLRFVETVQWSDGDRTLTWTLPREELRILPVAAY